MVVKDISYLGVCLTQPHVCYDCCNIFLHTLVGSTLETDHLLSGFQSSSTTCKKLIASTRYKSEPNHASVKSKSKSKSAHGSTEPATGGRDLGLGAKQRSILRTARFSRDQQTSLRAGALMKRRSLAPVSISDTDSAVRVLEP